MKDEISKTFLEYKCHQNGKVGIMFTLNWVPIKKNLIKT
jgi:hypothetical protein